MFHVSRKSCGNSIILIIIYKKHYDETFHRFSLGYLISIKVVNAVLCKHTLLVGKFYCTFVCEPCFISAGVYTLRPISLFFLVFWKNE